MANFIPLQRDQALLLPPNLMSWLPDTAVNCLTKEHDALAGV